MHSFGTFLLILTIAVLNVQGAYTFEPRWECDMQFNILASGQTLKLLVHDLYVKGLGEYKSEDSTFFVLYRPDLKKLLTYSASGWNVEELEHLDLMPHGTFVYKEEAMFNGQKCFKYYNETTYILYADETNTLLAIFEEHEGLTNYTDYKFDPVPATEFVIPTDKPGANETEAYKTPSEDMFYTEECPKPEPSRYFTFKQKWGCDVQFMECFPEVCVSFKVHGQYIKGVVENNLQYAQYFALDRPDLGKSFFFDLDTNKWEVDDITPSSLPLNLVFTHRDEAEWNGKPCYRYYNDTAHGSLYADADGILYGIWSQGNVDNLNFSNYKFVPIPATEFMIPADRPGAGVSEAYKAPDDEVYYTEECPGVAAHVVPLLWVAMAFVALLHI